MVDANTVKFTFPTPQALSDFGLSRYVGDRDGADNPFITVAESSTITNASRTSNENLFMNEVVLDAFEYQPVQVTTAPGENGLTRTKYTYGGGNSAGIPPILAQFRILLSQKDITVSHNHNYQEGEGEKSILSDFYGLGNKAQDAISYGASLIGAAGAKLGQDQQFVSRLIFRTDYQKVYKSTQFPSADIEFILFTNNNFIDDIYAPILFLTSLTYPQRINLDDIKIKQLITNTQAQKILQTGKELFSVTARQYAMRPPCLFNVYHQSGLYSYLNCNCTSMSVTYSGPWYNATASDTQRFNLFNSAMSLDISNRLFPSVAKIRMSFETSELMMRDDFIALGSDFKRIINSGETTFKGSVSGN